jgi:predicted phage-related endonuclease
MLDSSEQWKAALLMRLDRTETVELGTGDSTVATYVTELEDASEIEVERDESDTITVRRPRDVPLSLGQGGAGRRGQQR